METQWIRTEMVLGETGLAALKNAKVAIFGIGGVGGFAVEALARAGVGRLDLYDSDTVALSNINRQIIATHKTVGRPKVEAMAERIHDIDPTIKVEQNCVFYLPETADDFDLSIYDYVLDAIDTVSGKLELVQRCTDAGVPIISAMGAGNKLDPTRFEVADITQTSVCPLARVMRRELKNRGIEHLKVVYSKEEAIKPLFDPYEGGQRRVTPASISFVPSVVGLIMAGEVIKDIAWNKGIGENNAG